MENHTTTAKKIFLAMKLTVILTLCCVVQASARIHAQNITIDVKDKEISKVLSIVEKQTDFRFLFNSRLKDLQQKVTINVENTDINGLLQQIFTGTALTYKILNNNLVAIRSNDPAEADIRVSGRIVSDAGEPLAGVSVTVKGTKTGTSTNSNGEYSITVPENAVLVFSIVGFAAKEVAVNGQQQLNVSLVQSNRQMDEVVVIGYGSASKRDLTGSIVKIAGKDIADKPNTNPVASLQGKVAGLSVVNSGKPGQEPDIRLRGTVSRTQTKPLYIVDGIFNDNIDFVNPNDIESIEVLKDASSLAIFGVRGANGVIAIVTKKGKTGQMTVNFNTSVGVQSITDKVKLVDAAGYKTLLAEQLSNTKTAPYQYLNLYNGNTDWQDAISQKGLINVNNISITSGTEKNRFYLGLGYTNQEGIIKHELLKKYSINFSDDLKVSKNIKIGINLNGYNAKLPQFQSFFDALSAAPIIEPYNSTLGAYSQTPFGIQSGQVANPLRVVEETAGQDLSSVYRVVGNIYTEINLLKNLTFKATYYTDLAFNNNRRYSPIVRVYNAVTNSLDTTTSKTQVSQKDNTFSKFQQDYLLTYKKQFGDHGLTLLGGFSTIFNSYHETNGVVGQFAGGTPIPNDKRFWYLDNFFGDPSSRTLVFPQKDLFGNPLPLEWEQTTVSYFGRALYNYQGKYLLNASFRRDGSSDISSANQFQNFAAVGFAWDISKEKFMYTQKIFDYLKLKTSWGILGNQYTAIHYPFYPLLTASGSAVFGSGSGQQLLPAYAASFIPDPNLQWETINSTDVGIEFGTFKNRLRVEAAYYKKITDNLLTNFPALNGQRPGITNAGKITNNGIELSASWSDKLGNGFGYNISGNITTLKNKVNSVYKEGTEIFDGPTRTRAGDPIGSFYGYVVDGVYQDAADSAKSPNNGYHPGDLKFKDLDGDGKISDKDRTIIGNPTPKSIFGFSLGVNYKGFDLGIDFQGVSGNQIYRTWGNGANYARLTYRAERLNRWHGPGTSNTEPWINDFSAADQLASTYMIENGSYLRIRNLQLGYTFGRTLLTKVRIKSARLYLSAQNLKTFKHNTGYTPEFGGTALQFGVDAGSYPVPAIITTGLNISF
jgi:TonB-linked SusC/RagA family outer membrane protein